MQSKNAQPKNTRLVAMIQELIQNKMVSTQEEICSALAKKGMQVNQVTVSRLLNKMGAIKMNKGDQSYYQLASETVPVTTHDPLQRWILNINHNETLILIHTVAGAAHIVARILDQDRPDGVLGTVAGDDTIMVVPEKVKELPSLFKKIKAIMLD